MKITTYQEYLKDWLIRNKTMRKKKIPISDHFISTSMSGDEFRAIRDKHIKFLKTLKGYET